MRLNVEQGFPRIIINHKGSQMPFVDMADIEREANWLTVKFPFMTLDSKFVEKISDDKEHVFSYNGPESMLSHSGQCQSNAQTFGHSKEETSIEPSSSCTTPRQYA